MARRNPFFTMTDLAAFEPVSLRLVRAKDKRAAKATLRAREKKLPAATNPFLGDSMRTMLVNPTRRYGATKHAIVHVKNPRRRRRGRRRNPALPMLAVANPRRRRRMSNPLVLPNAPRRRRRNPSFDLNTIMNAAKIGVLAGGGTYLVNKFGISKLGVDAAGRDTEYGFWIRQAARVGLAAAATAYLPGSYGSAVCGAMMYPFSSEFDAWWTARSVRSAAGGTGATRTEAALEADLRDVLDGLY